MQAKYYLSFYPTKGCQTVKSSVGSYRARAEVPGHRTELSRDVRHALESTGLAIVVLDLTLKVRGFTQASTLLFALAESDHGRQVQTVGSCLQYEELAEDCAQVIRTSSRRERDVPDSRTGLPFHVRVAPYTAASGVVDGVMLTFTDIGAIARLEGTLLESQERLRMIARVAPSFLFTTTADMAWIYVNPLFYEFTGMAEGSALGEGWLAAVHPEDRARTRATWLAAATSNADFKQEFRLRAATGGWRWFAGRAAAKHDGNDVVTGWSGSCANIDERHRAEERQHLLLNELQHRVKNILAVVRSVLTRTLNTTSSLEEFGAHFSGRFSAISRTQGVLARTPDGLIDLEELVSEELCAQGIGQSEQVSIKGQSVSLGDRTAQTLGLAIHELTTNALKFGALSMRSGAVSIRWRVTARSEEKRLLLEWEETGVEDIDLDPEQSGFGRELIEKGLPYELQAQTRLEFRPGGVWCGIELPLIVPSTNGPFLVSAS